MTLNQIIGNNEKTSKIDTELWKKMNEKYSGIETKTDAQNNNQPLNQDLEKTLKYDSDGKPQIDLTPLINTAIHLPTKKDYDNILKIYESANWRWANGFIATNVPNWHTCKEDTIIRAGTDKNSNYIQFRIGNKEEYEKNNWNIITLQDFYVIQNITPNIIKKIDKWYDKNKPDRESKR
jgi:hypothetical protein